MILVQAKYEDAVEYCGRITDGEYFNFCFEYTPETVYFREIDRFLWESRHECARFRNSYDGPAVIDISEWADELPNKYFKAFLYFLKDRAGRTGEENNILLCDRICGREISDAIEALFQLKTVTMGLEAKKERTIGFAE